MRIRMLLRRGKAAERLDDELEFHLEQQIAENVAAGMSAGEARYAALRSFGNPGLVREQARATWNWGGLESIWRDVRYGVRTLRRTPGFAAIAIVVMALGIGANVALFTVVRSVLMKPLPFKDPDSLLRLYEQSAVDDEFPFNESAAGVFAEWKKQNHGFTDMALAGYTGYNLSGSGEQLPEGVHAAAFSWNLLPMLGLQPALGRGFTADDDRPSANPTVLLSWGLWQRRFGGNPAIVNQSVLLDAKPYTVIGVMPAWFAYPDARMQLWTPISYKYSPKDMETLDSHDFLTIGRLKPGVNPAQAVAELSHITLTIRNAHPNQAFISKAANWRPLLDSLVGDARTPLLVLLAATGCVLLIACLNVANLLVARAAARRKELAVRTALGGSRMHILRQHLMESLLLSAAGGGLGFLIAVGIVRWFVSSRHDLPRAEAIHVDPVVVGFTLALVALCAAFAGIVSSFSARGNAVLGMLQDSSRAHSAGSARTRLRAVLLAAEVGLTVVLLIGAGLLLKSYARLRSADLGCETHNVLTMTLALPDARYHEAAQRATFFAGLLARVRNLPEVRSAGLLCQNVPGSGYPGDSGFVINEHPPLPPGKGQYALNNCADPGYFKAIGIPILKGRTFDDTQQPGHLTQIIVSAAFVRQYFPGEEPIGKHLRTYGKPGLEIVGVVGDTRFSPGEAPRPSMYFPLYALDDVNSAALVVRSDRDVTALALPIQRLIGEFDHDLPVSDVLTMEQVVGRNTVDASFNATLLLGFAAISLILAAIGLFGVLSYIVAQRTSEIGIRIALGAQRQQVMGKVLLDGLRPALFGLVFGLAGSLGAARLLRTMLYGTRPLDPTVFGAVAAMLLLVAALACLVPSWRASRLDPMQALRTE